MQQCENEQPRPQFNLLVRQQQAGERDVNSSVNGTGGDEVLAQSVGRVDARVARAGQQTGL